MADIRPADDIDFARFYGGAPHFEGRKRDAEWIGYAAWRGRAIAGFGGMIELDDGLWLAFLDVSASERRPFIYRHILKGMARARSLGCVTLQAFCDPDISRADALMLRLGFSRTDELIDGKAVWTCSLQH